MYIETERFGNFELADSKVITFPRGIPGFEELRKFIILEIADSRPLLWLQSVENKYIALPMIVAFDFIEDFYIGLRDSELEELDIEDESDLLVTNIVVIPEDIRKMTVNLAAPVVINVKRGIGKQIIIDAEELPTRYPIYEPIMNFLKGGRKDAGTVQENG